MAGATRINSRLKFGASNRAHRKAKAQPKYRFGGLYGELLRQDVLNAALEVPSSARGSTGSRWRDNQID